jgi:hypothetical protein
MNPRPLYFLFFAAWFALSWAQNQSPNPGDAPTSGVESSSSTQSLTKIPPGVILVKGAWSSASDSETPVPEDGNVADGVFTDRYFGIRYTLPPNWSQEYEGPPPTESGRYVLAQLGPTDTNKTPVSMVITAEDLFFSALPAVNAVELTDYLKDHLQADYQVEIPPTQVNIAGRLFAFFGYWSPVAQLHWYLLATEIRCHTVQIILTSRDPKLLQGLMQDLNKMTLPAEANPMKDASGESVPVCIRDYAREENVVVRQEPVFGENRFNPVPVRIIVDKEGNVKHIHFISAFPDQAAAIRDAVLRWKFKPYSKDGKSVEVETGILFGRKPRTSRQSAATPRVK